MRSETSKYRGEILDIFRKTAGVPLETLNGIDLGCGGDAIVAESIAIDYDYPYAKCGYSPLQLKGDCKFLNWFADNSLDYLYSSHLFEDFEQTENEKVLLEWIRVLKPLGYMLLLLPDQQRYKEYCSKNKELPNEHHKISEFGPNYLAGLVAKMPSLEIVYIYKFWEQYGRKEDYNFFFLMRKVTK
jgi:predicted SAM-dependent methyltransferase